LCSPLELVRGFLAGVNTTVGAHPCVLARIVAHDATERVEG
jgi:hypothetical protein